MAIIGFYKVEDFFVLNPMGKITTGGFIGSMVFIKIPNDSSSNVVCEAIAAALSQYKENVPNPTDWKIFAKESNLKLKAIGLKSEKDLHKIGNKFCMIKQDEKGTEITPSKNVSARKYFEHLPDLAEHISPGSSCDEVLKGLENALAKCQ